MKMIKKLLTIVAVASISSCYLAHAQNTTRMLSPEADAINVAERLFLELDQKIRDVSALHTRLMSAKNQADLSQINNEIRSVNAEMNLIHEKINDIVLAARKRILFDTATLEAVERLQQELSKKKIR